MILQGKNGFKENAINNNFKRKMQFYFRRLAGVNKCYQEVNTLYYFLNKFVSIQKVPHADGALGDLQKCDLALLKIFDKVCSSFGLIYWLDAGTLLGAVRHSGFIPWDDDMDVIMPRKEYDRALKILPEQLSHYGIDIVINKEKIIENFGIGYKHNNSGIWLDVFPADIVRTDDSIDVFKEKLTKCARRYDKQYRKSLGKKSTEQILKSKNALWGNINNGKHEYFYLAPEFIYPTLKVIRKDCVFPLTKILFEDQEFFAPRDIDAYLTMSYGKSYMSFPKSGVEHHGTEDDRLTNRAQKNSIDMKKVLDYLSDVLNKL